MDNAGDRTHHLAPHGYEGKTETIHNETMNGTQDSGSGGQQQTSRWKQPLGVPSEDERLTSIRSHQGQTAPDFQTRRHPPQQPSQVQTQTEEPEDTRALTSQPALVPSHLHQLQTRTSTPASTPACPSIPRTSETFQARPGPQAQAPLPTPHPDDPNTRTSASAATSPTTNGPPQLPEGTFLWTPSTSNYTFVEGTTSGIPPLILAAGHWNGLEGRWLEPNRREVAQQSFSPREMPEMLTFAPVEGDTTGNGARWRFFHLRKSLVMQTCGMAPWVEPARADARTSTSNGGNHNVARRHDTVPVASAATNDSG